MITFQIDMILKNKGKSRYWLSKETGISENAINNLCKNKTSRINFDTIEKICKALECTPNDIIISDDKKMNRLLTYGVKVNESYNKSDTE